MTRKKKPSGNKTMKSGNDFLDHAKNNGAVVHEVDDRGFKRVETPSGSTWITPGDQPLDPRTRKNLKHWFRLLGLISMLCLVAWITLPIWYQTFLNILWVWQHS